MALQQLKKVRFACTVCIVVAILYTIGQIMLYADLRRSASSMSPALFNQDDDESVKETGHARQRKVELVDCTDKNGATVSSSFVSFTHSNVM